MEENNYNYEQSGLYDCEYGHDSLDVDLMDNTIMFDIAKYDNCGVYESNGTGKVFLNKEKVGRLISRLQEWYDKQTQE